MKLMACFDLACHDTTGSDKKEARRRSLPEALEGVVVRNVRLLRYSETRKWRRVIRWRSSRRRAEENRSRCRSSHLVHPHSPWKTSQARPDLVSEAEKAKRSTIICTALCSNRCLRPDQGEKN
jgi:hypothetical protein